MTSGTFGAMRKALEFEITAQPAAANFGSISRAMAASTGKDDLRRAFGLGRGDGHPRDALGQGSVEPPLGGLAIGFAARPVAGRQPLQSRNQGWFSSS